jgi:hypothetical protein
MMPRQAAALWHLYRLRPADYDRMLAAQGGRCAECGRADVPLVVDHDHNHCGRCAGRRSCGQSVRGLVCRRDNLLRARRDAYRGVQTGLLPDPAAGHAQVGRVRR